MPHLLAGCIRKEIINQKGRKESQYPPLRIRTGRINEKDREMESAREIA